MITKAELDAALAVQQISIAADEVTLLARYAAGVASKVIVEIGAGHGGSAALLLVSAPPLARVHSIDPFIQDSDGALHAHAQTTRENVVRALGALGYAERLGFWLLHIGYSWYVRSGWCDSPIGLLFIDGDHRYEGVRRDFEDWYTLVANRGIIVLHDSRRNPDAPEGVYDWGWPGPTRLAEELRADPRVEFVEAAISMTVWRVLKGGDHD